MGGFVCKRVILGVVRFFLDTENHVPRDQIVCMGDNHIVEEARSIRRIARRHDRGTVLPDGENQFP